jgi:hypothetical protein
MVYPRYLFTVLFGEYDPWIASCIMPIPIPAIPSPAVRYIRKSSQGLAIIPRLIMVRGTTNSVSIKTDLATMLLLANLLMPLTIKYWLTR